MKTERPRVCCRKRWRYWDSKITPSDISKQPGASQGASLSDTLVLDFPHKEPWDDVFLVTQPPRLCFSATAACVSSLRVLTTQENHKAFLNLYVGFSLGSSWKSSCLRFLLVTEKENVMIKYTSFPYPKQYMWRNGAFSYSISWRNHNSFKH